MKWMFFFSSSAIALSLLVPGNLLAQSVRESRESNDGQQTSQRQSQSDRQQDVQRSDALDRNDAQQSQRDTQQRREPSQLQLDPKGWVRIATDYDHDGKFEAIETIYYFDLERARQASKMRRDGGESGNSDRQKMNRNQSGPEKSSRTSRTHTVTGSLKDVQSVKLSGQSNAQLVGRIKTEDGRTARVLLGPTSQVSLRPPEQVDRIRVRGHSGRVNDRPMLIADEITVDGRTISIDHEKLRETTRVRGEIQSLRTASFRGFDKDFLVGKVKLKNGETSTVNFGPKGKLDKLTLQEGSQVSMVARRGRVNGKEALIAQEILSDGQNISVPRPESRRKFGSGEQDSNQIRDRQQRQDIARPRPPENR